MVQKSKVEIIQPPTSLRDRVVVQGDNDVDFSAAHDVVAELAKEFVERLPDDLAEIDAAYANLKATLDDDSRRRALFRLVHNLKGQAGTFDYMLITVIGNDLCRFLEISVPMTPDRLKVAGFFIDALKRVAEKRMTGDGGEHGQRMIDTLHRMTQKVLQE